MTFAAKPFSPTYTLWLARTVLSLCLFAGAGANALAVDIEETLWGFDGRVVPYQFNPVSVLVSNTTEEPVGVQLQLRRETPSGDRVGAKIQEEVFLSPFSSRWVQFYPYIANKDDDWSVSWGFLPSQSKDLLAPTMGMRARVALVEAQNSQSEKAKAFPEELFPPFVSATDSLEVVYLDHVPRWQDPRRQAFLEWVQSGGTLVVTPNSAGEYPTFTSQLAIFNSGLPELAVGQGQVIRATDKEVAVQAIEQQLGDPVASPVNRREWDLATNIFQTLKSISTPKHNWWVIHFMSLIYVGLVFPGWYLLSRASRNYRTTILAFVGVAIFFTFAFNMVGRRGYGESTAVHALAVARQIDGNQWDVQSWNNVFVTGGDQYDLAFEGDGHLYSTATDEKVPALIDNGLEGKFIADIPLFSSRSFMHRGTASGPEWEVSFKDTRAGKSGKRLVKNIKFNITPKPKGDSNVYVIIRNRLHQAYEYNDVYRVGASSQAVSTDLLPESFDNDNRYNYYQNRRRTVDPSLIYRQLVTPAIWRTSWHGVKQSDRMRVLIYDDLPASFSVKNEQLGTSMGKVVYSLDVRLPYVVEIPKDPEPDEEEYDEDDEDVEEDTTDNFDQDAETAETEIETNLLEEVQ